MLMSNLKKFWPKSVDMVFNFFLIINDKIIKESSNYGKKAKRFYQNKNRDVTAITFLNIKDLLPDSSNFIIERNDIK